MVLAFHSPPRTVHPPPQKNQTPFTNPTNTSQGCCSNLAMVRFILPLLAFSMSTPPPSKTIYGVPNSGWTSPEWNWGYGVGTGHDCAAICRQKYASRKERLQLIQDLLEADPTKTDMEEIKLVMALEWQRNRRCGYGDVLEMMADARRYEEEGDPSPNSLLLKDMMERFHLLNPTTDDLEAMKALEDSDNIDGALRSCSGLVLKAMGFAN